MRGFAAACSPLCGDASAVWKALLPTGYTARQGGMDWQGFAPASVSVAYVPQALRYGSAASQRKGYLRLLTALPIRHAAKKTDAASPHSGANRRQSEEFYFILRMEKLKHLGKIY